MKTEDVDLYGESYIKVKGEWRSFRQYGEDPDVDRIEEGEDHISGEASYYGCDTG